MQRPRLLLHGGDEIPEARDSRLRRDDEGERAGGGERDRREASHRVVGKVALERGHRAMGRGGEEESVAVGRGLGDEVGADGAARARLVLDHDRGSQLFREARGDEARDDVGAGRGRVRDDDRDRARGEALRVRFGYRKGWNHRDHRDHRENRTKSSNRSAHPHRREDPAQDRFSSVVSVVSVVHAFVCIITK